MYTFPDGTLRPCAARYGIRSVYATVYTARVDEHIHGCVWDMYTTVYMALYGRVQPCTRPAAVTCRLGPCTRPCRPTYHVHDCVLAVYTDVYTDVYMARTLPFNCGVDVCTCRTAVYTAVVHGRIRGVAKNSFWVGIIFLLHDTTVLYTSSLTTSAAISAQNNFQGLILGGYIYRYTPPRRYAAGPYTLP